MNATILLGTLKKRGLSNTETLCEFVTGWLEAQSVTSRVIKLVDHEILPGLDGKAAGIVIRAIPMGRSRSSGASVTP